MIFSKLFPQLANDRWGKLNLNEIAVDLIPLLIPIMSRNTKPQNPFLNPDYCDAWKAFVHKLKGIDYSWGGYLEDRAIVWAGHYQDPGSTLHVGLDLYVSADMEVRLPFTAKLVYSSVDLDQEGGWGGRVIFQHNDEYVIFAHLKDVVKNVGETYEVGSKIGLIAEPSCNGGWSPHLHVQRIRNKTFDEAVAVDGYLKPYPGIEKDFPNPEEL